MTLDWFPGDQHPPEEYLGQPKCIGCGKFIKAGWNQCADCDTREPEEKRAVVDHA